jgi:hypothetical protein
MQFQLYTVREVSARFVNHDMPARYQEKPLSTLEKKAAGIGQWPVLRKGAYTGGSEKQRFNHFMSWCSG